MPAIFIVVDGGDPREKAIMVEGMTKLKKEKVPFMPIVISDCQDSQTQQFLLSFTGNPEQIYYVPRSGPTLSPLLCVVVL